MIRAHVLPYYLLFNTQYLSHAHSAGTNTLKEYLSLLPLPWQPTTAQSNPAHMFIFSYIEKVSIQSIFFYPVLTCISMETCRSFRARWRIAAAAHNLCVLIGQIACQSNSLRTVHSSLSTQWRPGLDLRTGILGTCLCSLVQGGPNTMKIHNIFCYTMGYLQE